MHSLHALLTIPSTHTEAILQLYILAKTLFPKKHAQKLIDCWDEGLLSKKRKIRWNATVKLKGRIVRLLAWHHAQTHSEPNELIRNQRDKQEPVWTPMGLGILRKRRNDDRVEYVFYKKKFEKMKMK